MGSSKFEKRNKSKDKKANDEMKQILTDPRFSHVPFDPKYQNVSEKELKIRVDKRFKSALTDEKFRVKPFMDPRGRPKGYGTKQHLSKFYDLKESDYESEDENAEEHNSSQIEDCKSEDKNTEVLYSSQIDQENINNLEVKSTKTEGLSKDIMDCLLDPERDLARGETFYSDDSSDDDSTTTEEDDDVEFEWAEMDADAEWDCDGTEVEETSRFAVCNMDWDSIKAVDLFVLFSSFVPSGGLLKKVSIYLSEYGKARLKEEEVSGPKELVMLGSSKRQRKNVEMETLEKIAKGTLDESTNATPKEIEALRRYQRNKLKYYYAVIECDSVETAKAIYKDCHWMHFEMEGIMLDLRYIPEDMEFSEVTHDKCEKISAAYESEVFQTPALLASKPNLTWDETDRRRKNALDTIMTKALKKENINDDALKDFIGSSGDEEEDEMEEEKKDDDSGDDEDSDGDQPKTKREKRVAKFRSLLDEIYAKEKKKKSLTFDMEETFDLNDKEEEHSNGSSGSEDQAEQSDNESNEHLTPFEKMLVKRKQKRKEKAIMKKEKRAANIEIEEADSKTNDNGETHGALAQVIDLECGKKGSRNKKKSKLKKQNTVAPDDADAAKNDDLSLLIMDEEEMGKKHFDMRKIMLDKTLNEKSKKRKRSKVTENEEEENFKVDTSDPRFSTLFSHGSFNLDPSHPKYNPHSSWSTMATNVQNQGKKDHSKLYKQTDKKSHVDTEIVSLVKKLKTKTS